MSGSTSQSTLELILKAIDQASPTLGKIAGAMQKQGIQAGVAAAVTSKAFGLAGEALHKVVDLLGGSVDAYREQEVATARLGASLNANVRGWQANAEEIHKATEAAVQLGFTDTAATNAMAGLVAATHDVAKATEIMAVAQDLARFKGISLEEAAQALTKVEAGSYRVLKSLGIQLKDGATQTEALAAVTKVAGGQARAFAETDLGKVTVASAKAEEAQERFGKALSKIGAIVVPAASNALADFFESIDNGLTALDTNNLYITRLDAAIAEAKKHTKDFTAAGLEHLAQMEAESAAIHQYDAEMATHGDALIGARVAVQELGLAETQAHPPTETLHMDLRKVTSAAEMARDAIGAGGLASAIGDELFGKAITAGNEARLKTTIADLVEQRKQVKEGSLKYIELTGEIAQNREELFNLHLEQAAQDGPAAAIAFLEQTKAKMGDANGAIARLITQYKALAAVQQTLLRGLVTIDAGRYAGKTIPMFAAGGYAKPGEPAIVGEDGPELIIPRGSGVDVVPQPMWGAYSVGGGGGSGGPGGAPAEIVIQLDGREVARFIDRRLYLALGGAGGSQYRR